MLIVSDVDGNSGKSDVLYFLDSALHQRRNLYDRYHETYSYDN